MIKSVQTGLASMLNNVVGDYGTNYGTNVAINAVDSSKVMLFLGSTYISRVEGIGIFNATIRLTTSTNLQISVPVRHPTSSVNNISLRWQVIEFY
jgi:hypothetical protein